MLRACADQPIFEIRLVGLCRNTAKTHVHGDDLEQIHNRKNIRTSRRLIGVLAEDVVHILKTERRDVTDGLTVGELVDEQCGRSPPRTLTHGHVKQDVRVEEQLPTHSGSQ